MKISYIIDKNGNPLNGPLVLVNEDNVQGEAGYTLTQNQLTFEFFTGIKTLENGLVVVDTDTAVTTGLSGTITIHPLASKYAPYPIQIVPSNILDISNACIVQFSGILYSLNLTVAGISGCDYIRILIDRTV